MLRRNLSRLFSETRFRHRGKEIFRIEGMSDAVFAFSVSLLVASLEVPQTFYELKIITAGAIPFFLTVAMIFLFWYRQYIFFRRYGINDLFTILLNLAYLAVILFYVYPLKFLFSLLVHSWSGIDLFPKAHAAGHEILSEGEFPQLIILFSIGYFLIWLIIYLLHIHVMRLASSFEFNRMEFFITQKETRGALWNFITGLMALIFAWMGLEILAGICYLLIPLTLLINHRIFKARYNNTAIKMKG